MEAAKARQITELAQQRAVEESLEEELDDVFGIIQRDAEDGLDSTACWVNSPLIPAVTEKLQELGYTVTSLAGEENELRISW